MMRATCQMRCMPHNGSTDPLLSRANKLAQTESLKNDKQHPLLLSRERERDRVRGKKSVAERECLLYPVEVRH